jgi:hypothetical protein
MAGSPGCSHILVFCRTFVSRGGGTRTHTPFQDPDFKSENCSPSAYHYVPLCGVDMPKTRLLWSEYLSVSNSVLTSIAAALLPGVTTWRFNTSDDLRVRNAPGNTRRLLSTCYDPINLRKGCIKLAEP